jgi:hypothetical protein
VSEYTNPRDLPEDEKYLILLAAFTAFVMLTKGCTQDEALPHVAKMCTATQIMLFEKKAGQQ